MMKGMFFGVVMVALLLVLSGCAPTHKSLRERGLSPLTHQELKAMFARTVNTRGRNAQGITATGMYTRDGVAKLD